MTTYKCIDCGKPYELPDGILPDREHRKRCPACLITWSQKQDEVPE